MAVDVFVASLTVLNCCVGCQFGLEPKHIDLLVVQDLVGLEEGLDLVDSRSGNVSQLLIACINRVFFGNSNQLVVGFSSIIHPHYSQNPHWHQSQRRYLDAGNDHDVEWIVVKSDSPRQESIVNREDNRSSKDAVEHQKSSFFIELILSIGSFWDFDDGVDSDWCVHVFLNAMQRMLYVLRGHDTDALSVRMKVMVEMSYSRSNQQGQKQTDLQHQQILWDQQASRTHKPILKRKKADMKVETSKKRQSAYVSKQIFPRFFTQLFLLRSIFYRLLSLLYI